MTLLSESPIKKSKKQPKKVLHFYDGILEEYSSEEEEENPKDSLVAEPPNPKNLAWVPWVSHVASTSATSALAACDYVGEGIANFLGITSPKYFYEIEEYKRSLEEEETLKKEEDAAMIGWTTGSVSVVTSNEEKYALHGDLPPPSHHETNANDSSDREAVQRF